MLSGNYPFKGQNERDLFGKIGRGLFHMPETMPFEAKRLIAKMLSVDPHKRPSAKEVNTLYIKLFIVMFGQMVVFSQSSW